MNKRVGVIGFGKMGILHGALAGVKPGLELVAICEKSKMVRSVLAKLMPRVAVYEDCGSMIDEGGLDALIISTPTFSHAEPAIAAARKGIALFVEKPLAINVESALAIARAVESGRGPSMVGFSFRFYPTIAKGREILAQGEVGRVLEVHAEMFIGDVLSAHSGWRYNPSLSGGGALIDFGIHMIDLLVWYFGRISTVKASTKRLHSLHVEDEVNADIRFESGTAASFESSWSRPEYRKATPKIHIKGELGDLIVTEQTIEICCNSKTRKITFPDVYKGDYVDIAGINYSLQMKEFSSVIAGGITEVDAAHGAYIQNIVDCIYRSAAAGTLVEVK